MEAKLQASLLMVILVGVSICWSDINHRKIKNSQIYQLLVVCLYIMAINGISYLPFIATFTVLIIGFVISTLGYIGAGDVKLYATFLLAISPAYWSLSLVAMIIIGGILACSRTTGPSCTQMKLSLHATGLLTGGS